MSLKLALSSILTLGSFWIATAPSALASPTTWAQSYGVGSFDRYGNADANNSTSGTDTPMAIGAMPDGGMVVAGDLALPELWQTNGGNQHACAGLVRYAADGQILWQKLLRQDNDEYNSTYNYYNLSNSHVYQVLTDAQGNIFLNMIRENAGADNSQSGGGNYISHGATIAKFNADGTLLWQSSFGGDAYGDPLHPQFHHVGGYDSMSLTADGGLVVCGSEGGDESSFSQPFFFKIQADGTLGLHRAFAPTGQGQGSGAAAQSADGTRFLMTFAPITAFLVTDATGNVVAERTFGNDSDSYDTPVQAIANADGTFTVLSVGRDNYGAYVFTKNNIVRKLNPDLTSVWETVVRTDNPGNRIAPTSDGGYVITSTASASDLLGSYSGNTKSDAVVVRLDANGQMVKAFLVGGSDDELSPFAVPTADGGFAVTSTSYSYHLSDPINHPDWWTVKTDSAGVVKDFHGVMGDVTSGISTHANTTASTASTVYNDPPSGNFAGADYVINGAPNLVIQDLDAKTGVNKPTITYQTSTPIPPPVHGGLSDTVLTVNGTNARAGTLTGPVLSFLVQQGGRAAHLTVHIQSTTTPEPNDASNTSWTDLPTGAQGRASNIGDDQFVLNTTAYPSQPGLFFRAVSSAPGYPDSISNYVGSFDASQAGTHLPPVVLLMKPNGTLADLSFIAGVKSASANVGVRVQSTTTPGAESSWTDLADGNRGQMTRSTNPNYPDAFLLLANRLPAGRGVYFRAIGSLSGSLDSISNIYGSRTLTNDIPPVVTLRPPTGLGGSGTKDDPIIVPAGQIQFSADAVPDPQRHESTITTLKLQIDGSTIQTFNGAPGSVDYRYTRLGEHILEALAIDDLGATSRAGTGVVHILVVPPADRPQRETRLASANHTSAASAVGRTYTAVVSDNSYLWDQPEAWLDAAGNHGVPGPNDLAILKNAGVFVKEPVVVRSLFLDKGAGIFGSDSQVLADVTVTDSMTLGLDGGSIGGIHLTIANGARFESLNTSTYSVFTGSVDNYGDFNLHGTVGIKGITVFNNHGTSNFQLPIAIPPAAGLDPTADIRLLAANSFPNIGTISGANVNSLSAQNAVGVISSDGASLVAAGGGNLITQDGAGLVAAGGGNLIGQDGAGLIGQDGAGLIGQDGAGLVAAGGGNVISSDSAGIVSPHGSTSVFTRSKSPIPKADSDSSGLVLTNGEVDLSAVTLAGSVRLDGGILAGSGMVVGNLTNNAGYIAPGHSAGAISVTGSFTQGMNGTLVVENGGATPDAFDQLLVGGVASLGGKLDVKLINGYTPDPADTFNPLGASSISGAFDSVSSNAHVSVTSTGLLSSVNPAIASPSNGQPLNISTRLEVLTNDNILIGGFIVYDPSGANASKKVLIRGLGPSLPVSGTLSDPYLELHKPDGSIVANDNWQDASNVSDIPTGFSPSNPHESALVVTLAPGAYTAQVKGAHGETGVGLVEVYDLDAASSSKLANISTRGFVDTGDNVMIGGFIVGGQDSASPFAGEPARILVRAIGPSLANSGVQGAVPATLLEIHDTNGNVISNDGWRSTQEAEIIATTIPPTNDNESAIVATLPPGAYTAIVRGKDDATGVAVVEAYNLQ